MVVGHLIDNRLPYIFTVHEVVILAHKDRVEYDVGRVYSSSHRLQENDADHCRTDVGPDMHCQMGVLAKKDRIKGEINRP